MDFEINTSLHHQATAKIKVTIGGEDKQLMHSGVGPVDAAISALRDGLDGKLMAKLTDYTVNILTGDIDATVEVKMTLVDGKRNNKVVSRATSPDVIVASLKAYEKGINLLWAKIK